jgi:hypothetical protein
MDLKTFGIVVGISAGIASSAVAVKTLVFPSPAPSFMVETEPTYLHVRWCRHIFSAVTGSPKELVVDRKGSLWISHNGNRVPVAKEDADSACKKPIVSL